MVTANQLSAALRSVGGLGGQGWSLDTLADGANEAMKQAGITTRNGAAVFIAQCMVESAYFRTTREYNGSSTRYAPYYGRGFIQVTWRDNYAKFGAWCKSRNLVSDADTFVKVPDRLADPRWAWLGAVWYFRTHRHGLVELANKGDNIKVGRAINRGDAHSQYAAYGEDHRQKAYNALLNAGITAPGKASSGGSSSDTYKPTGTMTVKQVQTAVGVTADGVYGSGTMAAVKKMQSRLKVSADGKWGPGTEKAYKASKAKPAPAPAPSPAKIKVDGDFGVATIKALQRKVKVKADGVFGTGSKKAVQAWLNVKADGVFGKASVTALQRKVGAKPVNGVWGTGTTKALQTYLNK